MDNIGSALEQLHAQCEKECSGKSTKECNDYYLSEYKETRDALFNAVSVIANRLYELNEIK